MNKRNRKWIGKVMTVVMVFSLLTQMLAQPVILAFAETNNAQTDVKKKEQKQETVKSSTSQNSSLKQSGEDEVDKASDKESDESANANDSPLTQEDVLNSKEFKAAEKSLVTIEDINKAKSRSEQEALAKQSTEWQSILRNPFLRASGTLTMSEHGNYNIHRTTPSGLDYLHDSTWKFVLDGEVVFCVEEGVFTEAGIYYDSSVSLESWITDAAKRKKISMIAYFGWYTSSDKSIAQYTRTQLMIWETIGGKTLSVGSLPNYDTFKTAIEKKIADFNTKPSFDGETYTVRVGTPLEITDTKGVLTNFTGGVSNNTTGTTVKQSGNKLTITATGASNDGVIQLRRLPAGSAGQGTPIVYKNKAGAQSLGKLYLSDPGYAAFNLKVIKEGYGKVIKKDAETGEPIEGTVFEVKNNKDSTVETLTTGADGSFKTKAYVDGTVLTITEKTATNGYVHNKASQQITIEAEKTKAVEFTNKLQTGLARLFKEDKETGNTAQGDATLEGAIYALYKEDGTKVGETTLKAKDGKVQGEIGNLPLGEYYWQEVQPPTGYVLDNTKIPVSIKYAGQDVEVSVKEETAKDKVIRGSFDITKYGTYDWLTTAWNWITGEAGTSPTLLKGAEFTLYREYGDKGIEQVQTTDDKGFASFKDIPYGKYRVSETKTPEGYRAVEDFYVDIKEDGQTHHYQLEDKVKEAKLKVVKVDSETGKNIIRAEAGFELYSKTTGKQLVMKDENGKDVSVFYTDKEGILNIPTPLAYGKYTLKEVQAPSGYILAKETAEFEVTGDEEEGLITIVFKNDNQKGQLQLHKDVKTPMTVTEKESDYGKYHEIEYTLQKGQGFEFKIKATEDITTADGTVRLKKGEYYQEEGKDVVLTTDENGNAETNPYLYIGKYELEEVKAPHGVVMLKQPEPFEIEYAGQLVEITSTTVQIDNELQTLKITGHKDQEVVTGWKDNQPIIETEAANNQQVFALKNADTITINDIVLEAGTILAYAPVKDGKFQYEGYLPVGKYYFEEVESGDKHVTDKNNYSFEYQAIDNNDDQRIDVYANGFVVNEQVKEDNADSTDETKETVSSSSETTETTSTATMDTSDNSQATSAATKMTTSSNESSESKEAVKEETTSSTSSSEEEKGKSNDSQPILNKLFKVDVPFKKINETAKLQEGKGYEYSSENGKGAEFVLTDEEGTEIQKLVIGEDGIGIWKDLPVGTYYQKETKASDDNHVLNDETYKIVVSKQNVYVFNAKEEIIGELKNKEQFSEPIEISDKKTEDNKEDSSTETSQTSETSDSSNTAETKETSSTDSITKKETIESSTSSQLTSSETSHSETSTSDSSSSERTETKEPEATSESSTQKEDDATKDTEEQKNTNESDEKITPLFEIENKYKKGTSELTKQDVSTGKVLPDTGIKILDENDRVVVEGRTNSEGKFVFENLPKGKYKFVEFDAPKGYLIDETPVPFEIKEDGEIAKCVMTNQKELPQTGKNTPIVVMAALLLMSAGISIVGYTYLKRKGRLS